MRLNLLLFLVLALLVLPGCGNSTTTPTLEVLDSMPIELPEPRLRSDVSLEEALLVRRSIREYTYEALTLEEVSQLLWAAQGITAEWGGRTAPSAGALYPLEVYLVVGNVENLALGVYKYKPHTQELIRVKDEDVRGKLAEAAVGQACVKEGAIDIVIAAIYERTTRKYADRGVRYVHMEAGHAAQNLYLQVTALNLGMVTIGAFYDDQVKEIVGMLENEAPLYVIPVGRRT
jgi:SagB-type dehydrogenase family enzyme